MVILSIEIAHIKKYLELNFDFRQFLYDNFFMTLHMFYNIRIILQLKYEFYDITNVYYLNAKSMLLNLRQLIFRMIM